MNKTESSEAWVLDEVPFLLESKIPVTYKKSDQRYPFTRPDSFDEFVNAYESGEVVHLVLDLFESDYAALSVDESIKDNFQEKLKDSSIRDAVIKSETSEGLFFIYQYGKSKHPEAERISKNVNHKILVESKVNSAKIPLSQSACKQLCKTSQPLSTAGIKELLEIGRQFDEKPGTDTTPRKGIKKEEGVNIDDLQNWIKDNFQLRRNEITRYIENKGRPMQQKDFNSVYLDAKRTFSKLNYDLLDRTINSNFTPTYNPIIDFIEDNKHRRPDGTIDKLFDTIRTDTGFGLDGNEVFPKYKNHFGKKWIVSIISSIYGNHSPLMFVLSGGLQGTGKTEWLRRLLPSELRAYYAESKLDAGKDDEILMTQKLIIMDDEMGGKSKKDEKRLKELLSKQTFSLREPYGRNNVDLRRLAVLCGTTNDNEILSDPTGNRRIIPVNVLSIDHEAYNAIDKIDVLIEAYHLYKDDFEWRLTTDDVKNLNGNTSNFEQTSAERDLIIKYFKVPVTGIETGIEFMTATEIKASLESRCMQKLNATRLGLELKKTGFVRYAKKISSNTIRGYNVIDRQKNYDPNHSQNNIEQEQDEQDPF